MKTEHINFTEKALQTLPLPDKSDDVAFHHGLKTLHNHKMITITRDDIARLHATLRQTRGPATANHALSLISNMYNKAIDQQIPGTQVVGINPGLCTHGGGTNP